MKGISMSINVIIILVVGLIVLAALIVMFMSSATPGGETMKCQTKWNAACANYIAAGGCNDESVDGTQYFTQEILDCMGITNARNVCCHSSTSTTTTTTT